MPTITLGGRGTGKTVTSYLSAYYRVAEVLDQEDNWKALADVENTLLKRMAVDGTDAMRASKALMAELGTEGGKAFVMAAAVDIEFNKRVAGSSVSVVERIEKS